MEGVAEGASAKASMHRYANDEKICMEGVAVEASAEGVSSEREKAMLQRKGVQSSRDGPEFKSEEHNNRLDGSMDGK